MMWFGINFGGFKTPPYPIFSTPFYNRLKQNYSVNIFWARLHNICSYILFVVCLLFCWGFIIPLENFSLIWTRYHYQWRAANFDLCSALMAIEQWGFFSVPHLLWHGTSVYNRYLQRPVKLTPIAERLAVELSLPVFTA